MSTIHGKFVWCELMTTDTAAAERFYNTVIGWQRRDSGIPGRQYTMFSAGNRLVGGLMELPPTARQAGAPPMWIGYIGADDVDAAAQRFTAAGGRVYHGPEDIPGIGRFVVLADPQHATIALFKPSSGGGGTPPAGFHPGHVGWHELHAADREAAFAFYAGLFGWTKAEAIDIGAMGVYQMFALGGTTIGGMMTRTDAAAPASWLYYFNVEHIDAALARVKDAGGTATGDPQQVPGGGWIAHCRDPEGARFAMFARER
jgi:hypothetical protein